MQVLAYIEHEAIELDDARGPRVDLDFEAPRGSTPL